MSHEVKNRLPVYIMHTDGDNNDDKLVVENGQGSEFFVINKESDKRLRFEDRKGIAYYSDYDVTNQIRLDLNSEIVRSTGKDNEHDTKIAELTQNLATETQNRINADSQINAHITNEINTLNGKIANISVPQSLINDVNDLKNRKRLTTKNVVLKIPDFTVDSLLTKLNNYINNAQNRENILSTNLEVLVGGATVANVNKRVAFIPDDSLPLIYDIVVGVDEHVTPHKNVYFLFLKTDITAKAVLEHVSSIDKVAVIKPKNNQVSGVLFYYE